ncbi:1-phosphofructokinase [Acetobacterium carbinolicum]|jgi:1-phosphofructokinase|uniref:1-phosphofructokinase n=1 Tax=Acetobacterium TaxID=33951 RepID=UPI000DBEC2A6|nr:MULTISPECIES: 1-phosphofructokinase [unclassified Acetobacterium]AWW27031.1 1-phosphofructokinase [Acetobacterium sp. KB-1]MDK2942258.1 1-phosphofructokinase [Acetobacterium sp.]MDZ5726643.1 1-phosphofructokinase [Acetobacterium sp. K1/6]
MIFTVTFNPSLDYVVGLSSFREGEVNRSEWEHIYPGGKGINVSMVLKNLDIRNIALGFVGGFTGKEIERRIKDFGCYTDFVKLKSGNSRINVKIKAGKESEINGQGPGIGKKELSQLFKKLEFIETGDMLVLAGSIPAALPEDTYENIMRLLENRGVKIVVDATGELLLRVVKYQPFLIKPNNHELGDMFGVTLTSRDDIITYGKRLQEMGAKNVLVSMAGEGALLVAEDESIHEMKPPEGVVKNSVGAGDSMVAGFIAGYLKNQDLREAFVMGVATGSASAFSETLATREEVLKLLNKIEENK